MGSRRTLPWDWHPGTIPDNVVLEDSAYIESTLSFALYCSEAEIGLQMGKGAAVYQGTMFDLGPFAQVRIGEFALLNGARIICDGELEIGNYVLISWQVVLMDSYRVPLDFRERRAFLQRLAETGNWHEAMIASPPARPIRIGDNVWIGFDTCILPGVTIGEGAIVGARSVVREDVPAYTIVAGNPARIIRRLR